MTIPKHEPLNRLVVRNFQSIKDADVHLGSFTVLVGSSNSGKSALLRALKAVARNVSSPAAVRHGSKTFVVTAEFGENSVSIERGKSQSTYRVLTVGGEDTFTKSGRSVPDEVQSLLGLPEPESKNLDLVFSAQTDTPYLLDEPGSSVAKVLGNLTNASRLHTAAREANRRRLQVSRRKEVRREDLEAVTTEIQRDFSTIADEKRQVEEARQMMDLLEHTLAELDTLGRMIVDIISFEESAQKAREALENATRSLPDLSGAEKAVVALTKTSAILHDLDRLKPTPVPSAFTADLPESDLEDLRKIETLLEGVRSADTKSHQHTQASETASIAIQKVEEEHGALLREAGICPTCGRST